MEDQKTSLEENKGQEKKTGLGLEENLEGLLCYVLGFVTGIIFLILEKKSNFVKFHAWQSIIVFLPLFILTNLLQWIPFLGFTLTGLLWVLQIVLWIILMIKAFQGEKYKLPLAGDFAEKQSNK